MATRVQLSNFMFVNRPQRHLGQALRFTFAISVDFPNALKGEFAIEGCLAYQKYTGKFVWMPPLTSFKGARLKQIHWINPVLYNLVMDALLSNPVLVDKLKVPLYELMKKGSRIDPDLPELIETSDESANESDREST